MNPYLKYVEDIEAGLEKARDYTVSGQSERVISDSKVLLFSPHPDDECITGLLPLRLMREAGKQIINVPVTFGSNEKRQSERRVELENSCDYLGWDICRGRQDLRSLQAHNLVHILLTVQPDIILIPHARDWNLRHIATHYMVIDALVQMGPKFSCTVVETEYWGMMDDPNLMVGGNAQTVADLVAASSLHVGEVSRNPYHLLLPAWMQDNVRRGSELIGGQGGSVSTDFGFATLYRMRKWQKGGFVNIVEKGKIITLEYDWGFM